MLFRDEALNIKDNIIKKKNSEIESRLFGKTQYYVIAVGKRSFMSEKEHADVRAYIYFNGYICFYNSQGKAYNQQEYMKYIDFVKQAVNKNKYQWTNFWINKGQLITRSRSGSILVDNQMVTPLASRLRINGPISEMSMQILYDFLVYTNEGNEEKLKKLEFSYNDGSLKEEWERKIRKLPDKELLEKDGEIIVRSKIEGYNFITANLKSIIKSNEENKLNKGIEFLDRVFYLEMYGYILNMDE